MGHIPCVFWCWPAPYDFLGEGSISHFCFVCIDTEPKRAFRYIWSVDVVVTAAVWVEHGRFEVDYWVLQVEVYNRGGVCCDIHCIFAIGSVTRRMSPVRAVGLARERFPSLREVIYEQ